MNQAMKQRLAGTLVLGCLAIILIPLLLDGAGIQPPPLSATIPPAPVLDDTPIAEPVRPEITADRLPAQGTEVAVAADTTAANTAQPLPAIDANEALVPAAPQAAATPAPAEPDALEAAVAAVMARNTPATSDNTPALDASGLPLSYVVRVGSFGSKENADALVARLLAAGHKAYARQVSTANGAMTAVYAGPVLTREEASTLRQRMVTDFQLRDGVVETFTAGADR